MDFDDWMLTKDPKYHPTDDTVALRRLRGCWNDAQKYADKKVGDGWTAPHQERVVTDKAELDEKVLECRWEYDSDGDEAWFGECGCAWTFIDGGPKENNANFCPECGGKIE